MNLCKTCGTICPFDDERTECDAYAPMTNENWFISLSTEEKAKWLKKAFDKCCMCGVGQFDQIGKCPFGRCRTGLNEYEDWLKEKHDEM